MKLELPVKIYAHTHIKAETPMGDCHLDITVDDKNDNGDPEITVKWDLPGKALDSGAEGKTIEVPVMSLLGPMVDASLSSMEAAGAPDVVVSAIKTLATLGPR